MTNFFASDEFLCRLFFFTDNFFIKPTANSVYNCHNPTGIKLITRLRLGLSHLREHKFKHNFKESLNPFKESLRSRH